MKNEYKLIIFDMDGVLVDINSSWYYVHKKFGVDSSTNFNNYLKREIDYTEFMRRDIRLWGKCHITDIQNILNNVPLMKGSKEVTQELKNKGYKLAIISAGIFSLAERVSNELNFDYVFANQLCTDKNNFLTGEGIVMVDLLSKDATFNKLIEIVNVTADQCVSIGDSQFDIPIFNLVGLSIAFNTSDEMTKQAADKSVEAKDLRTILPLLD